MPMNLKKMHVWGFKKAALLGLCIASSAWAQNKGPVLPPQTTSEALVNAPERKPVEGDKPLTSDKAEAKKRNLGPIVRGKVPADDTGGPLSDWVITGFKPPQEIPIENPSEQGLSPYEDTRLWASEVTLKSGKTIQKWPLAYFMEGTVQVRSLWIGDAKTGAADPHALMWMEQRGLSTSQIKEALSEQLLKQKKAKETAY